MNLHTMRPGTEQYRQFDLYIKDGWIYIHQDYTNGDAMLSKDGRRITITKDGEIK